MIHTAQSLPKNIQLNAVKITKQDAYHFEIELPSDISMNPMIKELDDLGIDVLSINSKTNRLEALFMELIKNEI